MDQEAAFVQTILAHPEDESARLVYADWLEERGDPRGEFIRVEHEMTAVPVHSDRYVELKARRNELVPQIDKAWRGRLGYVPTYRPMFTHLPEGRAERWRLVEEFIDLWYDPLRPGAGASEEELRATEEQLGFRLPAALREWHALAGKRKDVWSKQDALLSLPELTAGVPSYWPQNALVVYIENQGCVAWGVRDKDLQLDDPPIYRFLDDPCRVSPRLTTFAIQVLLYEAKGAGLRAGGGFSADSPIFRTIRRQFRKCDLPTRYWLNDPIRVYEGQDVLIETHANQWVRVSARTEAAYQQLPESLRVLLRRYMGEDR
jgi:uncharacterized protein (TIGR02996 family)